MIKYFLPMAIFAVTSCADTSEQSVQGASADTTKRKEKDDALDKAGVYTLVNKNNCKAVFTDAGARLMQLQVPDKNGKLTDVVIGFTNPEDYAQSTESYFGATIGRYGNNQDREQLKFNLSFYC